MISVEEADKIILNTTKKVKDEIIRIDNSNGRILSRDIYATRNQPPFHRVMMDGIAIDSTAKSNTYKIQGVQAAGDPRQSLSDPLSCIEVMTGAALPDGCDCVIQYENIEIKNNNAVIDKSDIQRMNNIHQCASDYKEGDPLLKSGTKISAPIAAIIASQGKSEVHVCKLPKIAIISTGSELVELDHEIQEHQIFMSNSYSIESELRNYGINNIKRIHIDDNREQTKYRLNQALEGFDLLIITGGVSKGKFDYIPQILSGLGVEKRFHRVMQKPGKPMWYGTNNDKQIFALPGNPVSCLVCLRRYVIPSLNFAQGLKTQQQFIRLEDTIKFKPNLTLFAAVNAQHKACGSLVAKHISTNSSGDFYAAGQSTGFIQLPHDKDIFTPGNLYPYYPWL